MAVPQIFDSIEQTNASIWIRETASIFGFYFILLFHNFALTMLVGGSTLIDLRILGAAPQVPLKSLKPLYKVMGWGIPLAVITGVLLLFAYPTKQLTNPVFYLKLVLAGLGVAIVYRMKARVFDKDQSEPDMIAAGKAMAMWSLVIWIATITAGRLLAYTFTYLLYGRQPGH